MSNRNLRQQALSLSPHAALRLCRVLARFNTSTLNFQKHERDKPLFLANELACGIQFKQQKSDWKRWSMFLPIISHPRHLGHVSSTLFPVWDQSRLKQKLVLWASPRQIGKLHVESSISIWGSEMWPWLLYPLYQDCHTGERVRKTHVKKIYEMSYHYEWGLCLVGCLLGCSDLWLFLGEHIKLIYPVSSASSC